jgi:hypothetical protein
LVLALEVEPPAPLDVELVDERRPEVAGHRRRQGSELLRRQAGSGFEEPAVDPVQVVEEVEDVGLAHGRSMRLIRGKRCQVFRSRLRPTSATGEIVHGGRRRPAQAR